MPLPPPVWLRPYYPRNFIHDCLNGRKLDKRLSFDHFPFSIRPKSKSVVHAFPPSPTDLSEEKNADNKPRFFTGSSPVLPVKDLSTTIPSSPSDTPIKAADLPRAFATSLIIKNPGSVMPNGPETPETVSEVQLQDINEGVSLNFSRSIRALTLDHNNMESVLIKMVF